MVIFNNVVDCLLVVGSRSKKAPNLSKAVSLNASQRIIKTPIPTGVDYLLRTPLTDSGSGLPVLR
jgi:hypothetical protein